MRRPLALVPEGARVTASILAREKCVVAGTGVAAAVFAAIDPPIECRTIVPDGSCVERGHDHGDRGERERHPDRGANGAEFPAAPVRHCHSDRAVRRDRGTVWGLDLGHSEDDANPEKAGEVRRAVRRGENHRMGLYDRVLIKDNHRRLWRAGSARTADAGASQGLRRPSAPRASAFRSWPWRSRSKARRNCAMRSRPGPSGCCWTT